MKISHRSGLRAFAFCAAMLAAGGALAQQAAQVSTPTGPVAGPLDLTTALQRFPLTESDKPVSQLVPGYSKPKKLVVKVDNPARTVWLQEAMPAGVKVVGVPNDPAAAPELMDADAYVMAGGDCTPSIWKGSKTLKWIHSAAGGGDQCMAVSPELSSGKILFTNSQKVKSDGLAETAFGFIFALSRNMDTAVVNQQASAFNAVRATRPVKTLDGATMLVVGLGGAGTEIARIAHEFGMTVIGTRATSHEGPAFVQYVGLSTELPDMIGKADVVVIAAPLTPDTRNLFNAAMFAKMKKNAMLVDFSRAEIINADDLAAALKSGQLGSAGLAWATTDPPARQQPSVESAQPAADALGRHRRRRGPDRESGHCQGSGARRAGDGHGHTCVGGQQPGGAARQ